MKQIGIVGSVLGLAGAGLSIASVILLHFNHDQMNALSEEWNEAVRKKDHLNSTERSREDYFKEAREIESQVSMINAERAHQSQKFYLLEFMLLLAATTGMTFVGIWMVFVSLRHSKLSQNQLRNSMQPVSTE